MIQYPKVPLNNKLLTWNKTVKYLGHTLNCCNTFENDISVRKGQFIACINNILTEFGFAHPKVKMELLRIYGMSFYGCTLWNLYGNAAKKLYTTWNIHIRKIIN